jgi:uncharacterized membrane protein YebE (DUF533 family)
MFDAKALLEAFAAATAGQKPGGGQPLPQNAAPDSGMGGLGDILGQLKGALGQAMGGQAAGSQAGGQGGMGGGGLADILGQVLGQATSGVKDAAGRANDATGASDKLNDILRQITGGQSGEDVLGRAKQVMKDNQLGTGAVLGGLAAVLLGTKGGRAVVGNAAALGGIALIGGLAYKALQNYQAGKPIIAGSSGTVTQSAPQGTGFEPAAATHDTAATYLRAMIAAASADGVIDESERARIGQAFQQAGLNAAAKQFLEQEFANPASPDDLAAAASSPEVAVQIYTAASITVDASQPNNRMFLDALADALRLERQLAAHIDAEAAHHGV